MRNLILVLFLLISPLFSVQAESTPTELLRTLDQLNEDLVKLAVESIEFSGSDLEIVRAQRLDKNTALRKTIGQLIKLDDPAVHSRLITEVNKQLAYTNESIEFVGKTIKRLQERIDNESYESRLSLQNNFNDKQSLLFHIYHDQWQNYQWLTYLGVPNTGLRDKLRLLIDQKIKFASASLTFDLSNFDLLNDQLTHSSESEKAKLQPQHLYMQRKIDNSTNQFASLIDLADQLGLPTTDYKRQIFTTTGNLTEGIFTLSVITSISKEWIETSVNWILTNTPDLLFKLFIFALLVVITRSLSKITRNVVKRAVVAPHLKMTQLMQDFFVSISGKAVFFIGLLIALSQIGLNLAPVLTGFGVAGIIIGFALQDTLSNFASGMMLLIYRPFDVNDLVEAGGVRGKVSHMSLVNTTIRTFDNQIIILPNSKIWGDVIMNVTHERVRRVDMVFGIGYSDSIPHAERVLAEIIDNHEKILKKPECNIKVQTLNTSSVDFVVRPWVKTDDYWDVYWDVTREVKMRFDEEGISIPFPQQDVHIHNVEKKSSDRMTQVAGAKIGKALSTFRKRSTTGEEDKPIGG